MADDDDDWEDEDECSFLKPSDVEPFYSATVMFTVAACFSIVTSSAFIYSQHKATRAGNLALSTVRGMFALGMFIALICCFPDESIMCPGFQLSCCLVCTPQLITGLGMVVTCLDAHLDFLLWLKAV